MRIQRAIVVGALLTACALAAPGDPLAAFGPNVRLAGTPKQQVKLRGDLDGDKAVDQVYLVKLTGKLPAGVKLLTPVTGQEARTGDELALAVVLHPGGKPAQYVLRFPFYDSPTWKQGEYASLVKLGHGPEPPKEARGPSIGLFTESAAIYYFYWNGKTFVGSNEGDMP